MGHGAAQAHGGWLRRRVESCDLCGSADQSLLYERVPASYRCRARTGCEQRQLLPDLAPQSEDYAVVGQPQLTGTMYAHAARGATA